VILRRSIIIAVALLLAVQVVRTSAVEEFAPLRPSAAAALWPGHPSVEISEALARIGTATHERRPVDPATFAMMNDAAQKAPLSPEPFLVRGVEADTKGNAALAARAFVAAQWRDPRSLPAAYFLAQHYFRSGDPLKGLEQTALLARLSPGGTDAVAPYVASYAQNPANWPQIRALFRSQEGLEDAVLAALAQDSRNSEAILAVADAKHRSPDSPWFKVLLQSLVTDGQYGRARALWTAIGQPTAGGGLLYDPDFSESRAPPPFNWDLISSTVGVAEREPGKRLHVIFYGNEDGPLASELLLLSPGTYRLQMQLAGAPVHPETLHWSIRCDKSAEPLASAAVTQAASRGWTFTIPANCPAQWIELSGSSGDVSQQSDVTITGLKLVRAGANA
jgi:hypothetical protein